MTPIIIRCEKCGKILQGKVEKSNIVGKCPRCKDKFVVPDPISRESRKGDRSIVSESKYFRDLPDSVTKSNSSVNYRVVYTEAPPMEFALKRKDQVPLLDIGEGGIGFIARADDKANKALPGDILTIEIDFPIFVKPVSAKVEVCWVRPIKQKKLMQVGVRFYRPSEALKGVLKNIKEYIASKTQSLDFETWGSL